MSRETLALAVLVWLVGAVVGWCVGWAARGEQNRGWHQGALRQLATARTELGELHAELDRALEELDDARSARYHPAPAAPAVVHVHVAAPGPWPEPPRLVPGHSTAFLDVMPALPAEEVS